MRSANIGDVVKAREIMEQSPSYLRERADLSYAMTNLMTSSDDGLCFVFNGYLYLFAICNQWWTPDKFLCEEFVIRIDDKDESPPAEQAIAFLDQLAKVNECRFIVASDFLSGQLDGAYKANGYRPMGTTFIKDLNNVLQPTGSKESG